MLLTQERCQKMELDPKRYAEGMIDRQHFSTIPVSSMYNESRLFRLVQLKQLDFASSLPQVLTCCSQYLPMLLLN